MGSKPRISASAAVRRARRRLSNSSRRLRKRQLSHIGGGASSSIAGKLAALRNLIPSENAAESKPGQLFRETADYIGLLKTQVHVLQKLVDFYGSQSQENLELI